MAYVQANFGPVGGTSRRGNVPVIWAYKTDDAHAVVDGAGYFNDLSAKLSVGDVIWVTVVTNLGASNEAAATYGHHLVLTNAAGVVDCTNVTVGLMTDTD